MSDWQQQLQIFLVERRSLVMAVATVVVSVLLLVFAAWPLWQKGQDIQKQIQKANREFTNTNQQATILEDLRADTHQDYERVATALPQSKQPLANILTIYDVASQSGVAFTNYTLNPGVVSTDAAEITAATQPVQKFEFDIKLSGTYEQLQNAFARIENSLPLISIESFSLSSRGQDDQELPDPQQRQIEVEVQLQSYYTYLEATSLTKVEVKPLTSSQEEIVTKLREYTLPPEESSIQPQEFNNTAIFQERELN